MLEELIILATVFCPAYVPNTAVQLVRAALHFPADNGIKNRHLHSTVYSSLYRHLHSLFYHALVVQFVFFFPII